MRTELREGAVSGAGFVSERGELGDRAAVRLLASVRAGGQLGSARGVLARPLDRLIAACRSNWVVRRALACVSRSFPFPPTDAPPPRCPCRAPPSASDTWTGAIHAPIHKQYRAIREPPAPQRSDSVAPSCPQCFLRPRDGFLGGKVVMPVMRHACKTCARLSKAKQTTNRSWLRDGTA